MVMRRGIVVAVHPEDHSVDLVMADDGSRLIGVQIITPNGSTRSGTSDLPEFTPKKDKWDITERTGQDMLAVVSYIGRNPVVSGFLFPQVNQMLSKDPKLKMSRHQSDVMQTIDGDGNIQLAHPSGLFIKIGEDPEFKDYAKSNVDGDLAIDRNNARTPSIRISMPGKKAVITISPDGTIKIDSEQDVSVTAKGTVKIKSEGDMEFESGTHIKMTAPRIDLN